MLKKTHHADAREKGKGKGNINDPETCQKSYLALTSVPVTSDKIDKIGRRQNPASRRENACTWWERILRYYVHVDRLLTSAG